MMNKFKFLLIAVFALAVLAGPAAAATIVETNSVADPSYTPFFIAYEVYNNALGINADNVPVFIKNSAAVSSGESKNLRVFNGKVNLSGQNVFLLAFPAAFDAAAGLTCDDGVVAAPVAVPGALAAELVIGESIAGAVPSADVSLNIYSPTTFCQRNAITLGLDPTATIVGAGTVRISPNRIFSAGMGNVDAALLTATVTLPDALNFNVDPNLNPTCTTNPVVQLAYISQFETSPITTILRITPQFTGVNFVTGLNAELDTDFDFQRFVLGSGPNVTSATHIEGPAFRIDNGQTLTPGSWKAFVPAANSGSIAFNLNTINPEGGLTIGLIPAVVVGTNCVPNVAQTSWACALSTAIENFTNTPGSLEIAIDKDPAIESVPTVWTISDATIQIQGGAVTTACFAPAGQVGVWFGGLEAFVPFVKGGNGYETFIKLYNRYNKPAKLFAKTFKNADLTGDSNSMLVSTEQIVGFEEIPANDMITLTSTEIGSLIPGYDMSQGIPVKFLIRVPSQTGSTTYEGTEALVSDGDGGFTGTHSGSALHTNNNDPFVEGIVVSVVPGGGQRTIPLKFKSFKNGEYNH